MDNMSKSTVSLLLAFVSFVGGAYNMHIGNIFWGIMGIIGGCAFVLLSISQAKE